MQSGLSSISKVRAYWTLQCAGWSFVSGTLLLFYWPYARQNGRLACFAADMLLCFVATFALRATGRRLWAPGSRRISRGLLYILLGAASGFAAEAFTEIAGRFLSHAPESITLRSLCEQSIDYAILMSSWCIFYLGIKSFLEARQMEQLARDADRLAQEAQLHALRAQIQPHFLFNSLNAASSLLVAGYSGEARSMIEKLDDLLSAMLDSQRFNSQESHITCLAAELRHAQKYVEIQQVRFGEQLKIHFHVEAGLENFKVPRWFLVPLLENAIKHGLSAEQQATSIQIDMRKSDTGLTISVSNPQADSASKVREGFGIGLRNTRALLKAIYGEFASLSIERTPDSFVLVLGLPSIQKPHDSALTRTNSDCL